MHNNMHTYLNLPFLIIQLLQMFSYLTQMFPILVFISGTSITHANAYLASFIIVREDW